MGEKDISQSFRLKNINETRNYFVLKKQKKQKHKSKNDLHDFILYWTLNYAIMGL